MKMLKLVFAVGALSLGAGQPVAQELRSCAKDGSCVEFTVRYYKDKKTEYERVQIVDSVTKKPLDAKAACELNVSCKVSGNLTDITTITLMQTYNPHYCYRTCVGSWCWSTCPPH